MTKNKKNLKIWVTAVITALIFAGCGLSGGRSYGEKIPADAEVVSLTEVLSAPEKYTEGKYVLKGIIAGQCASLCEFFFKEGVHRVTIFPQGFKLPRLSPGEKTVVYVQVISGPEQVIFTTSGLEIK